MYIGWNIILLQIRIFLNMDVLFVRIYKNITQQKCDGKYKKNTIKIMIVILWVCTSRGYLYYITVSYESDLYVFLLKLGNCGELVGKFIANRFWLTSVVNLRHQGTVSLYIPSLYVVHNMKLQSSTSTKMVSYKWVYWWDKKKSKQQQSKTSVKVVSDGLLTQVSIVDQILFIVP